MTPNSPKPPVGLVEPREVQAEMTLQRGVFAAPAATITSRLYVEVDGDYEHTRMTLQLPKGSAAHTNTYFGRFAASYWQRWTSVKQVTVRLQLRTEGKARVLLAASDIAGHRRIVDVVEQRESGIVELTSPLDRFIDGGALWVEFDALGSDITVSDLRWTAEFNGSPRHLAIAICTFNRAMECASTIAAVANDADAVDILDALYVVDQGTDLVADQPTFGDSEKLLGDKLRYVRQPNLGGAGGFSRGLYEVTAVTEHADIVLMDDDIVCEPETLVRLRAFANFTVQPTLVGAQMLFLLNPEYLNVSAEYVDIGKLKHGRKVELGYQDESMLETKQERRIDAGYNAWWTCLIPSEVVAEIGLPLPLFFQWDDVEYGMRASAAGFATVTLSNAAVWHYDFYWKDPEDWGRFFATRNSLITASMHSGFDAKSYSKQFTETIARQIVSMQYAMTETDLLAMESFLEGPQALDDGGMAAMAAIRRARQAFPETVMHPATDAPVPLTEITTVRASGEPSKQTRTLMIRAAKQYLGKTRHGIVGVSKEDAHWWHIALFDHVVVTDSSQSGVRIRQRDKTKALALAKRTTKVLRRLRKEGPSVAAQFRDAQPTLTSRENWAKLYGL